MRIVLTLLAGLVLISWLGWDASGGLDGTHGATPARHARLDASNVAPPAEPLVPPIKLPQPASDPFDHDAAASFHPHGSEVCASGCAASRHPTQRLSRQRFCELLDQYGAEPASTSSRALDELLFYGAQTRGWLATSAAETLDASHRQFLAAQLKFTHVRIAIQLIDEQGNRRAWLPPTRVPLDRRHVFQMETQQLPHLVSSGTVKRVGLDRLWTRL